GKGLWFLLVALALVSTGIYTPAVRAADDDDGSPASAASAEALNTQAIVIDANATLIPIYRVTFMTSRTTDAIRTSTLVRVTNQGLSPCDIVVTWLRGLDPTPVCTTMLSLDSGFQTDFCSRAIPDALTSCNKTCAPELTFHEGTAVVASDNRPINAFGTP